MMNLLKNKNRDLSFINNMDDLDAEILRLKRCIKARESEIKFDTTQIPKQALQASLSSVVPFFKKTKITDESFNSIQIIIGGIVASIIAGKKHKGGFTKGIVETLRQVSFLGAMKAIISLFDKKNRATY
ncbi:hypothetical protein [Arachidicoccus sp.]|uniref:hypothetical protein n=1 Tax=Arachidicoccus sp. TaxID=1872624 RepID=UPI003D237295